MDTKIMETRVWCRRCYGARKLIEDKEPCWMCNGHGWLRIPKSEIQWATSNLVLGPRLETWWQKIKAFLSEGV